MPAHTAAHAAASGPWRAELGDLTFRLGDSLVPSTVRLPGLVPDAGSLAERLDRAERDYRAVAQPAATAYRPLVRLGEHTRAAMVDDMWVAARREAETASGLCVRRRRARVVLPHLRAAGLRRVRGVPEAAPHVLRPRRDERRRGLRAGRR